MINKENQKDILFVKKVLNFYKKQGRHDLPWRKDTDPYHILVSEIMLQQTQVSRVILKFEKWIELYPTLKSQKKASFKDILILWQGLGYQRRAKALYQIAEDYDTLPNSFEGLCNLPCVGTYTASAVCAFAYNMFTYPVLETNIRTVLIEEYHKENEETHDKVLYSDITRLSCLSSVKRVGARIWYYALMDYGAFLKENKISHNKKSVHYTKQSTYKGSLRELRAKVLFAITHEKEIPQEKRTEVVIASLLEEGFIYKQKNTYKIKE